MRFPLNHIFIWYRQYFSANDQYFLFKIYLYSNICYLCKHKLIWLRPISIYKIYFFRDKFQVIALWLGNGQIMNPDRRDTLIDWKYRGVFDVIHGTFISTNWLIILLRWTFCFVAGTPIQLKCIFYHKTILKYLDNFCIACYKLTEK